RRGGRRRYRDRPRRGPGPVWHPGLRDPHPEGGGILPTAGLSGNGTSGLGCRPVRARSLTLPVLLALRRLSACAPPTPPGSLGASPRPTPSAAPRTASRNRP